MQLELAGRTALVTGAHRGTGQKIAQILVNEGVRVLVHGFDAHATESVCESLNALRAEGEAVSLVGELSSDEGTELLLSQCAKDSIDILINNYGTAAPGRWESSSSDDWIDMYQKNVLCAQRLIQRMLPGMKSKSWGRIINLGTVGSTNPNSRMPHYYAAKGALANLTVSLAKEVSGTGITVNLVSPGLILTDEVRDAYLAKAKREGWGSTWEEVEAEIAKDIPIRRIVRREEVANLVAYLASPCADAIHGQNIVIDGGSMGLVR